MIVFGHAFVIVEVVTQKFETMRCEIALNILSGLVFGDKGIVARLKANGKPAPLSISAPETAHRVVLIRAEC
jgi:hypothetical protein